MVEPQRGGRITLFSAFLGVNPSGLQFLHHAALVKVENSKGYIVTPRRTLIKKEWKVKQNSSLPTTLSISIFLARKDKIFTSPTLDGMPF